MTLFLSTLATTRSQVRQLTHTLHLEPGHADVYCGPGRKWLSQSLTRLPRLQSLIVTGVPFFDHASLSSLSSSTPSASPFPFPLRMLDASSCPNATVPELARALFHFPDLVALNLTNTPAAKHSSVHRTLSQLRSLRVLKLAGLGLQDADLEVVAAAIERRVRSLDVRRNRLSDRAAGALVKYCKIGRAHV